MKKLAFLIEKIKSYPLISTLISVFIGILLATIPNILSYEWQKSDLEEHNKSKPSIQLLDINSSFTANDILTYKSEIFKIPDFLNEAIIGNPYIYGLPTTNQRISYEDLRNYFFSSHNFNKERPADIKKMIENFNTVYSNLKTNRRSSSDEINKFFLFWTTYGDLIFSEFNNFLAYSTSAEIEKHFKNSELFMIFKNETNPKDKPQELSVNTKEKLTGRLKQLKYYDFINDEKIGWKIYSKSIERGNTVTMGNYKNEMGIVKYYKFYVYSAIYYDKESLRLILDLIHQEYSDIDKICKAISVTESANKEAMAYFSRFKASVLFQNSGKTPITFMPKATLIIENPGVFEYNDFDGMTTIKKQLPSEVKIDIIYFESFRNQQPFRLEENQGKIVTMISQKQIKDIIDYKGILDAFSTGSLKCRIESLPLESGKVIISDKIDFRASSTDEY